MLYIFNPSEELIALLKPDFTCSTSPVSTSRTFLCASFPAEFDREPSKGCPYWETKHREVLNGENTFRFTVPAGEADAAYVQAGNLVAFKDLDADWQIFEIKQLVDLHGDGLTRTAYCEHIFYELLDDIVTDKRPSSDATSAVVGMLEGTRWNVGVVDDLGAASTNAYYEPVLSGVQKVANAWHGELKWRCVVTGGVITRYCDLRAMVGTDTGKQFVYSKDILSIEREMDSTGVVTALYGRGKGVETESGEGYGRRLTFKDEVAVDKPAGQEWVGDPTALAQWGRPGGRHRFGVFTDEEETNPAALLVKTRVELAKQIIPRITYRIDVISLEELTGYSHEAVRKGDLVRVIDREFTPELIVSARIVDIERDLLCPEKTKVILGSFAPTIVEATINTAQRVDEMANKPYNTAWLDGKISILQNEINNTQSFVFQTPGDGILILNAPTFAQATNAMKLGGGTFALANSKTGDQWNWRAFGDGVGFTADEMKTGVLNAAIVNIVSAGGKFIIESNGLKVYDASNALRIHIGEYATGNYGVKITGGEIYGTTIQSGGVGATSYVRLGAGFEPLTVVQNGRTALNVWALDNCGGTMQIYDTTNAVNDMVAQLLPMNDARGQGFRVQARSAGSGWRDLDLDARMVAISPINGNLLPYNEYGGNVGNSSKPWYQVRAYLVTSGDLAFEEKTCAICGQPFEDGDILNLLVKKVDENIGTLTIPVHEHCKNSSVLLDVQVPEMVTKYRLNDEGEVETYLDVAFDEIKEEITTLHPNFDFDEEKGYFKRSDTEENIFLFGLEAIKAGIKSSKRSALVKDTVIRKKPKIRNIQIQIGKPPY